MALAKLPSLKSLERMAESYKGMCVSCGTKHSEVEPDARSYTCKKCGLPKVYGAEELAIMDHLCRF